MTREEVVKILFTIKHTYPNWMPNATEKDIGEVADAWSFFLEDYEAIDIFNALKSYVTTTNTGFAPSVNQLIDYAHKPVEMGIPNEMEAWALVRKAINNGNYGSKAEFAKLPPLVQQAVGDADNIRSWAITDIDTIDNVIASNFQRTYRSVVAREKDAMRLPKEVKPAIQTFRKKFSEIPQMIPIIENAKRELTKEEKALADEYRERYKHE